jgi:hypothetical protein
MTEPGPEPRAPEPNGRPQLPPDPAAYDDPRAELARAKGLDAPYIAGGRDPDPEQGRREERRLLRLLVIMVLTVVLAGFVLGALATLAQNAR